MSERSKQVEQIAGVVILGLLTIGSIVIVLPFLPAILWAMVFAVTTWPLFHKSGKDPGRKDQPGRGSPHPSPRPDLLLAHGLCGLQTCEQGTGCL